jgi:nitroimidazol reductase NimA-like FMN-containing flavoprotein (pyridoxamine 5'-phosphate oxidase superfamily)
MEAPVDSRTGLEELGQDECRALVAHSAVGRIAVVVAGRPLVFPVNFTLDSRTIVFRTSPGAKLHGARNNPVAFECSLSLRAEAITHDRAPTRSDPDPRAE